MARTHHEADWQSPRHVLDLDVDTADTIVSGIESLAGVAQ